MEYSNNFLVEHIRSRYFNTDIHEYWLGRGVVSFPIWNLSGQLVGFQQYRPNASKKIFNNPYEGKYFTRLREGKVGVWGLESWRFSNSLFICEGIFDACKISYLGYSAIAIFSFNVNPSTARWLNILKRTRHTIAICDSDSSGIKMAKYGSQHVVCNYHDIGDAPLSYVQDLCSKLNKN